VGLSLFGLGAMRAVEESIVPENMGVVQGPHYFCQETGLAVDKIARFA
jgi:hypothetical protein